MTRLHFATVITNKRSVLAQQLPVNCRSMADRKSIAAEKAAVVFSRTFGCGSRRKAFAEGV
jgi:hypothetical protein